MAERLVAEWDGQSAVLVAVGAFHAQLTGAPGTMAHELARHVRVCTASIDYAAGWYWSHGAAHERTGTMPQAAIRLDVATATPAVVPGKRG